MHITELDYDLLEERIAQHAAEPRDHSRLLVCKRADHSHQHKHFYDLPAFLSPDDLLVANDTSVINARLHGRKPTGGKVEVLLLRKRDATTWEALVGGRNVKEIIFTDELRADVMLNNDNATFVVHFNQPAEPFLNTLGETPLPPYIHEKLSDPSRYQTVYARVAGSAAAPTAGLHFTPQLLEKIRGMGVRVAFVTLHVGLDTFKPIDEENVESHKIHTEWCELPQATADAINETRRRGGRVIAVGTTSARVLESAGSAERKTQNAEQMTDDASLVTRQTSNVKPYRGDTSIYITPGYQWKVVDALITNFHLPRSTLMAMTGSFMGMDFMRQTYALAIQERYRFFSFGDAMLIL